MCYGSNYISCYQFHLIGYTGMAGLPRGYRIPKLLPNHSHDGTTCQGHYRVLQPPVLRTADGNVDLLGMSREERHSIYKGIYSHRCIHCSPVSLNGLAGLTDEMYILVFSLKGEKLLNAIGLQTDILSEWMFMLFFPIIKF